MLLLQSSEGKEPGNINYNKCIMKESGLSQCDLTAHARSYCIISGKSLEFQNMLRAILRTRCFSHVGLPIY
jgi:uncharacterized protein YjbI with pentapeptide repeats